MSCWVFWERGKPEFPAGEKSLAEQKTSQLNLLTTKGPGIEPRAHCAGGLILALPSAYQKYLVTFKLMTSHVGQRARQLSGLIIHSKHYPVSDWFKPHA